MRGGRGRDHARDHHASGPNGHRPTSTSRRAESPVRPAPDRCTRNTLANAFGLSATTYGPKYSDVDCGGGVSLGFQQDEAEKPAGPLAVLRVDDLDAAVEAAGGVVTVKPFNFPGGRRFHLREPGGNELAAWAPTT